MLGTTSPRLPFSNVGRYIVDAFVAVFYNWSLGAVSLHLSSARKQRLDAQNRSVKLFSDLHLLILWLRVWRGDYGNTSRCRPSTTLASEFGGLTFSGFETNYGFRRFYFVIITVIKMIMCIFFFFKEPLTITFVRQMLMLDNKPKIRKKCKCSFFF